jgi:hypothetical protein
MPSPRPSARGSIRLVLLATLAAGCEPVTGPYGAALVLSMDQKSYEATAVPLSATTGYLTRYDFEVGLRLENRGGTTIALEQCDGSAVVMLASATRSDAELLEELEWSMLASCATVDLGFIHVGESVTVRLPYSGYSNDVGFVAAVNGPLQFVMGTPNGLLRSPSFRVILPPTIL